jgi:putative oxidoreductase
MTLHPSASISRPIIVLRVAVAILLGIHGVFRAVTGGAWLFGEYLSATGIPFGAGVAWAITIFEIIAAGLLAAGKFVRLVVPGYAVILTGGIIMVHGREGWFVVGGGRNGVEYSVLLLVSLAVLFMSHPSLSLRKAD